MVCWGAQNNILAFLNHLKVHFLKKESLNIWLVSTRTFPFKAIIFRWDINGVRSLFLRQVSETLLHKSIHSHCIDVVVRPEVQSQTNTFTH